MCASILGEPGQKWKTDANKLARITAFVIVSKAKFWRREKKRCLLSVPAFGLWGHLERLLCTAETVYLVHLKMGQTFVSVTDQQPFMLKEPAGYRAIEVGGEAPFGFGGL